MGAAIFRSTGEVISLGCNEVPKAGGGTYWHGDANDSRDFVHGKDPNEQKKYEILVDILNRLRAGGHLSDKLNSIKDASEMARAVIDADVEGIVKDSKLMDILEFGRIIHAEMSAISDAARLGNSILACTLYCTTFPCHLCAKHIVASGIMRVVYLEPYPKSYAHELHKDSIDLEKSAPTKVSFEPFIGVSPVRYRNLFQKGKRKNGGKFMSWHNGVRRPMIEVYYPSYFEAETAIVATLEAGLAALSQGTDPAESS